ncbi:cytochrome P450 [Sistotremastrum suecicum HHB10207 ss-3]|uniref:Cytochrome P450 n=1 Tax=Sistotremastrum suecicum HHB10207 ss-3 TaxID=1314776 RepID=A0A165YI96_9AGAM|nr:cytochrome P450 [Sistotremastrum suecicum HHB10207 ss-3]
MASARDTSFSYSDTDTWLATRLISKLSLEIIIAFATILSFYALFSRAQKWRRKKGRLPYPIGPRGAPIIGNALQMPLKDPWLKWTEWAAVYGDIFYLNMMVRSIVVLNSARAGFDLLTKRGNIYSDRPGMSLTRDHGGWHFNIATESYGEEFLIKRRFYNQSLNPTATKQHFGMLQDNARLLAQSLLRDSSKVYRSQHDDVGLWSSSVYDIVLTQLEFIVKDENDEWVKHAEEAARTLEGMGNHPIDFWPFLGKLPFFIWGKEFVEQMKKMKEATHLASTVPYDVVKRKFFSGTALPSMATMLLEENIRPDKTIAHEESINGTLSITYIVAKFIHKAGSDTTVSNIDTFIVAMIHHPRIQREAQRTIDELLQGERLPTLDDRGRLPYLEAILREVQRWKPVVPGGIPHCSSQDDEYEGMFIPKGTMVVFNVLICPGRHFASSWLWITIATLLTVFEISPEIDAEGKSELPELEYEHGHPKPFRCRLKLRPSMASFIDDE